MKSKFLKISAVVTAFAVATASGVLLAPTRLKADEDSPKGGCDGDHNGLNVWTKDTVFEPNSEDTESVKYYLTSPVELSEKIVIDKDVKVTICLNGNEITTANNSAAFYINEGGFLTICDCQKNEGIITPNSNNTRSNSNNTDEERKEGGAIYIKSGGHFIFEGGTISGFSVKENGGGVYNGGQFTMTGGVISGNSAEKGGGVYVASKDSHFTMTGGEICNNTVTHQGGGVYVSNASGSNLSGVFTMEGGTISNNTIEKTFSKKYEGETGGGVYTAGQFIMDNGKISGNEAIFQKNDSSTEKEHYYGGGVCVTNTSGSFELNGGDISDNKGDYGGGVYVDYGTFKMAEDSIAVISKNTGIEGGAGVGIGRDGTFTMNSGEISGNTTKGNGGGVYAKGTFTMNGGTIGTSENEGANTAKNGGGVYLTRESETSNGGEFTMKDGLILCNKTENDNGGGIYIHSGTLTMSGGTISNNTSKKNGGGVYQAGGKFTMEGGSSISGNTSHNGGGVFLSNGIFTMLGGSVLNNKATEFGCSIYMDEDKTNSKGEFLSGTLLLNGEVIIQTDKTSDDNSKSNVYLKTGKVITIGETFSRGDEKIGVHPENESTCVSHIPATKYANENTSQILENKGIKLKECFEADRDQEFIIYNEDEKDDIIRLKGYHSFDRSDFKETEDYKDWTNNKSQHWHECKNEGCLATDKKEKHDYTGKPCVYPTDNPESGHFQNCKDCNHPTDLAKHNYDEGKKTTETVIKEDAITTTIYTKYTCFDCHYSYTVSEITTTPIPATSESSPEDSSTSESSPEESSTSESTPEDSSTSESTPTGTTNPNGTEDPAKTSDPSQPSDPVVQPSNTTKPNQPVQPNDPAGNENNKPPETNNSETTIDPTNIDEDDPLGNNNLKDPNSPNPSTGLVITLAPLGTAAVTAVITSKRKKK